MSREEQIKKKIIYQSNQFCISSFITGKTLTDERMPVDLCSCWRKVLSLSWKYKLQGRFELARSATAASGVAVLHSSPPRVSLGCRFHSRCEQGCQRNS